ncbi:hypothetical protein DGN07_09520 [Xanthomonas citri pv. fuscans]|nr:hypothetical protein DGN07_09520 [Xanthomonas citri pv. fuscans]
MAVSCLWPGYTKSRTRPENALETAKNRRCERSQRYRCGSTHPLAALIRPSLGVPPLLVQGMHR